VQVAGTIPGGMLDGPEPAPGDGAEPPPAPEANGAGPPASRRRAVAPREASIRRGSVRIPEQYSLRVPAGDAGTRCTLNGP
jgi:hypothetical protein